MLKRRLLPKINGPIPGIKSKQLAARLEQYESPNITYIGDDFPIFWREGEGCLVKDADRNWFLDLSASFGVLTLGHSNPAISRTIAKQSRILIHGMGDVHPSIAKVNACREIAKRTPIANAQVILGLSGSDAVESALKTTAIATGKPGIIAIEGSYHGLGYGALSITHREDFKKPFLNQLGIPASFAPFPKTSESTEFSLTYIEKKLKTGQFGGVIFEPIQGRDGINIFPETWVHQVKTLCEKYQSLLIADEIFTGWGKTGKMTFCDCADIYCLGKSLAGGLPFSACVSSKEIMSTWGKSQGEAIHTSTFLGHPLACTVALTVLNEIDRLNLLRKAAETGEWLINQLKQLQLKHPAIIDIRGEGLMIGVEFNSAELCHSVIVKALKKGLIFLTAGNGKVIELTPPLIIEKSQLQYAIVAIDEILTNADKA